MKPLEIGTKVEYRGSVAHYHGLFTVMAVEADSNVNTRSEDGHRYFLASVYVGPEQQ